jgi:hypothetical protein
MVEPWLRGALPDVDPLLAPVLFALQQAREDLEKHTAGLTDEAVWSRPHGLAPLGFHLRHMAGSLDRLTTYLVGGELNAAQFAFLRSELEPKGGLVELLGGVAEAIDRASAVVRGLDLAGLREPRAVGRQRLPTTVMGLAVHLAEHTQRHVGQAIVLCGTIRSC